MKLIVAVCAAALLVSVAGFAQEGGKTTLKGYVVDQMCGKGMVKKGNFSEKAPSHTKDCALEESCTATGYGIFSGDKYYTFDEKGSALAKEAIEKSSREKGLFFVATGTVKGTEFAVASLKEGTPAAMKSVKKQEKTEQAEPKDEDVPERNPEEETEY